MRDLFISCPNWGVNANWGVYNECPTGSATNDNGTLQSYEEFQGGTGYPSLVTFNQTFTYDGLNRLTSASHTGGWLRTFNYDQWGNSWVTNVNGPLAGNTRPGILGTLNSNTPGLDAEHRTNRSVPA